MKNYQELVRKKQNTRKEDGKGAANFSFAVFFYMDHKFSIGWIENKNTGRKNL